MNSVPSSPDAEDGFSKKEIYPPVQKVIEKLTATYADKTDLLTECRRIGKQWEEEGRSTEEVSLYGLLDAAEQSLLREDMEEAFALGRQRFTS